MQHFAGEHDDTSRATPARVVAIDAVRGGGPALTRGAMLRDMNKARIAFEGAGEVATGHWGCGAYGNHHDLMFLKQWLAASEAGARTVRQRGRSGGRGRGCVGLGPSVGGTFLACRSHEN